MRTVSIYSLPTCHMCYEAKKFLNNYKVTFTDCDLSSDEALRNEMIVKSEQMSVPVIFVDKATVLGFDRPRLTELLEIQ